MTRRGIILAGGIGTRLHPLTRVTSKQLLPIYDKPMIYYPLSSLMLAGIRDILIITTPHSQLAFKDLLGSGRQWGLHLDYALQPRPEGVAQALVIAADFISGHPCCLILGDNILYGHGLAELLRHAAEDIGNATVFGYRVDDPRRYGVIEFDDQSGVVSIVEKPPEPKSNWAAIGLYFYDQDAGELVKTLKRSPRGEYEITDLNNLYIREKKLKVERMGRGFAWFDAGTFDSLLEAAEFVRVLQARQGRLICAPEEIAYHNGWISWDDLNALAGKLDQSYGKRLTEQAAR